MDDLKSYAENNDDLEVTKHCKQFSDVIGIQCGLKEFAKATSTKNSLLKSKNITPNINTKIIELEQNKTYEYLGIN